MLTRFLLTLALTSTIGVARASAQSAPSEQALSVPVPRSDPGLAELVTRRIFTLAWTDVFLPASLAAAPERAPATVRACGCSNCPGLPGDDHRGSAVPQRVIVRSSLPSIDAEREHLDNGGTRL
jgi:hypothetical protein